MKKVLLVCIVLVLSVGVLAACKSTDGYDTYLKSYASQTAYTTADAVFSLADAPELAGRKVTFGAYHMQSDVYLIQENIGTEEETNLIVGFASDKEVLVTPRYNKVLDIRGDYAIVVKLVAVGGSANYRVGVVRFRGENAGTELGFSYNYANAISQYTFLDDQYISILGDKEVEQAITAEGSLTYTGATIYDYTTANGKTLIEVARITISDNSTTIQKFGNDIISSVYNEVRFYDIRKFRVTSSGVSGGVLALQKSFSPFDAASYTATNVSCTVYYLGNGWYIINGVYTTTDSSALYDMSHNVDGTLYYLTIKSARMNSASYKVSELKDKVALVANQYNDDDIRAMADLNSILTEEEVDEDTGKANLLYYPPVVSPGSMVREGYSLVYYYYFDPTYGDDWPITFAVYDDKGGINYLMEENLLFPLLFVDGYGVFNSDPNFSIPTFEAVRYTYYKKREVLSEEDAEEEYNTTIHHGGMTLVTNLYIKVSTGEVYSYVGAYNEKGELAVNFIYLELTPFFSGYATGSRAVTQNSVTTRRYFRVSENGEEVALENVYGIRNGVYITLENEKYGVYANDGTQLVPAEYIALTVLDTYLVNGVYTEQRVLAVDENGCGVLFLLS